MFPEVLGYVKEEFVLLNYCRVLLLPGSIDILHPEQNNNIHSVTVIVGTIMLSM